MYFEQFGVCGGILQAVSVCAIVRSNEKSLWYGLNLGNTHSKRLNDFQAYNTINIFLVFKIFLNNEKPMYH